MKPQIINKYIYVKGKKISDAGPMEITGIEEIPVVCEDANGKTTVKDIADYVKRNSDYLTEDDLNGLVPTLTDGKIDSSALPESINELPQKLQNETNARVQGDADLSNRLNEATSSLRNSITSGDDSVRNSLNQRIDETNSKVASNYESVQEQIQTVNSKIDQVSSDIDDKLEDFVTKSVDGEEITGRKVFKKLPQTDIAPTESSHLTNKNYVDTAIQNASENVSANKVTIDTTQEITGSKSFKTLPTSSDTPSSPEDLVNKAYVDSVSKGAYVFDVTDLNDGDTVDESIVNELIDAYNVGNAILVRSRHYTCPAEVYNTQTSINLAIDNNTGVNEEEVSGISVYEVLYTINKESKKFAISEGSVLVYTNGSSNEYLSADGTYNQPTKETVGLDKVDNTADIDKPVSNPTKEYVQQQIEESTQPVTELSDRITTVSNELATERTERSEADKLLQASIDNVNTALQEEIETRSQKDTELQQDIETESTARTEEDAKLQAQINNIKDNIGKPGGSASLDESGKVPASQLPSYVDDVVEYDNLEAFPETGESGKIYVAKDNNLTYRWSGTQYVEISPSLALGETTGTAFDGGRGKAVEDIANKLNYAIRSYLLTGGSRNLITYSNNSNDRTVRLDYNLSTVSTGERSSNYVDIPSATTTKAGTMSAADKQKLDKVIDNGDGTKYLSDDGTYKELNVDTSTLATKDELTQSINQLGSTITSEVTELEKTDASLSSQISTINESIAGLADEYLPLTGGTLTGNLKVNNGIDLGSSAIRKNADSSIRFGVGSSLGGNQGYFGLMRSNTNIECIGLSESGDIRLKGNSINIVGGDNASTVRINGFDGLEFEFGKYCAVQYVEPDSYQTPSFFIQNITQSTYDELSTKDANTLYIITE